MLTRVKRIRRAAVSAVLASVAAALLPAVSVAAGSTLDLRISGNTISGNGGSGISVTNSGGTFTGTIRDNDISGNQTGVSMTSTGGSFTMDMGTTGPSGGDPGNNNITGNGTSVYNNTGTNVPAEGNFWGHTGPTVTNVGGSTTDTSNRRLQRAPR